MQMDRGLGRRKESFDQVADAYAEFRPAPPRDVIDAIVTASTLRRGSRVLEIGSGTGQLSVPLAQLDIELVAIELGPHLAALAERNLQRFPNAQVVVKGNLVGVVAPTEWEAIQAARPCRRAASNGDW